MSPKRKIRAKHAACNTSTIQASQASALKRAEAKKILLQLHQTSQEIFIMVHLNIVKTTIYLIIYKRGINIVTIYIYIYIQRT